MGRIRKFFLLLGIPAVIIGSVMVYRYVHPGDGGKPTPKPDGGAWRVVLDPGHGDHDTGAVGADGRWEKDDNLRLALRVRDALAALDADGEVDVRLTREDDSYLDLTERCDFANEWEADIFISLHRNSGGGTGIEAWKPVGNDKTENALAKAIHNRLTDIGELRDRGIRTGSQSSSEEDYAVNAGTLMPSCLLELGFMDAEADNLWFDEHIDDIAAAIAEGIGECLGLTSP